MRQLAGFLVSFGFFPQRSRTFRCAQLYPCAPCLRKSDRDCLLGRTRSVFSFAYVVHFFPNEFSSLRRWRFTLPCIFAGAFQRLFFRHYFLLDSGLASVRLVLYLGLQIGS